MKMISIRIPEKILELLKISAKEKNISLSKLLILGGMRFAGYKAVLCPVCSKIAYKIDPENPHIIRCPSGHRFEVKIH